MGNGEGCDVTPASKHHFCACADASLILMVCDTCLPDLPLSVTT